MYVVMACCNVRMQSFALQLCIHLGPNLFRWNPPLHVHCNATKKCKQGGSSQNKTQTTARLMRSFHPISPLHKMCFRSLPLWPRFALHYPTPMPLPITTLPDCATAHLIPRRCRGNCLKTRFARDISFLLCRTDLLW